MILESCFDFKSLGLYPQKEYSNASVHKQFSVWSEAFSKIVLPFVNSTCAVQQSKTGLPTSPTVTTFPITVEEIKFMIQGATVILIFCKGNLIS